MDQPTLCTARLILRPYVLTDAPAVQRLAGAAAVADTTLNIPHPYADGMAESWIATLHDAWQARTAVTFAITTTTHELCGTVTLRIARDNACGELGYWIGQPYWGQGIATEAVAALLRLAFETLDLHRVQASHFTRNPASGRVLQKVGMLREGLHRARYRKGTVFEDVIEYAVLRTDAGAHRP